ncbi:diguanylate cyclase domain-containing protein [Acidithiobacillus ferrooxidans]|uniref:diguanylate cyclase domain-containing protein n=1 Tax=Acidithiobacillus ferrooxidans TaxID=920 RepID=UPI001D01831B|nr:GGDEF domain-containing protein [Acidithiobacillus ferrooxidans]
MEGQTKGFIYSPFLLSSLNTIRTTPSIQEIVLSFRGGKRISVWDGGHWAPPGTSLPVSVSTIEVPVPGLSLVVHVGWTAATLNRIFWRKELPYLIIAIFLIGVIAASDAIQRRHRQELSRQSLSDTLTGLPNRHSLEVELEHAFAYADPKQKLLAVCILDLSRLKRTCNQNFMFCHFWDQF